MSAAGTPAPNWGPACRTGWSPAAAVVADAIAGDAPVYGVNTGFGALADTRVGEQDLERLQGAIVVSHAAGTGEPLDDATVRAILAAAGPYARRGLLGVRSDLPRRLLQLLDLGLLPVVPGKGSVGASGDLAQLAHLAQPLIGEGRLRGPGRPAGAAARRPRFWPSTGSSRWTLAPKEGLSLVNGTEPMQALLAFSVTMRTCWSRRRTSPARCRWRRCSAPTGPTTSGCRRSGRIRASWPARPTCALC